MTKNRLYTPDSDYPINIDSVPESWILTSVGDLTGEVRRGFYTARHNDEGIGIPHLRPMNIGTDAQIVLKDIKYVEDKTDLRVRPGEIVFNNTNSAELVGKAAIFDQDGEWTFSNHITRLRIPEPFSATFIAYQFLFLWREGYFRRKSTQHVSQASINSQTLTETIPLLLAPKHEQQAIVSELTRRFGRLQSVEKAVESARRRVREYERFVVQAAIEGTLISTKAELERTEIEMLEDVVDLSTRRQLGSEPVSDQEENAHNDLGAGSLAADESISPRSKFAINDGQLPLGWVWARVSDVGSVIAGRQRSPEHHSGKHMRPYLRVANVFEDRIDVSDVLEMNFTPSEFEIYRLQHGDILLNEGQSPELVGRPAMFRDELNDVCFQNTLIRFRAYPGTSPGFALLVFRAYLHNGRFRSIAKWTTNIAHLGVKRFSQLEFPLPPLVEQERIVTEAARRQEIAESLSINLSNILTQVDAVRHAALTLAFTGKLVSPISDDLSAGIMLDQVRMARAQQIKPRFPTSDGSTMVRATLQRRKARTALTQALAEADQSLSPEELLAASGIGEDLIDEFFAELKAERLAGKIKQTRDAQGQIRLSAVEFAS
ncbi:MULTISPECIES: hypothetical protein [unclassified Bradyrhizobium]|uniref:restriction endonuclease subunit S n=1 Tax=unclassified Bradyrhizobium TaxID=2631580 RepID=UPI0028E809FA|nr:MULTISPECIES: hypothetical protein [unclassified Bradyrhizobium]